MLVLVIGAAWVPIYRTVTSSGIDLDPFRALGRGAAVETAKLLRNSGRIVLVDASFGDYKILAPTTETQIKAFRKAIRGTGLKVAAVEKAAIAPPSMARTGIFMQPGQLAKLLSQHPDVDAVVLFVGLAGSEEFQAARLKGSKPKLVMVANFEPYYKDLLASQSLQLAIVLRPDADTIEHKLRGSQSYFERNYFVVTPETVAQLPD